MAGIGDFAEIAVVSCGLIIWRRAAAKCDWTPIPVLRSRIIADYFVSKGLTRCHDYVNVCAVAISSFQELCHVRQTGSVREQMFDQRCLFVMGCEVRDVLRDGIAETKQAALNEDHCAEIRDGLGE